MFRKLLQPFYTLYVVATFCASILTAFPIFALLSIGGTAWGRRTIHKIIRYWCIIWLWLIGMPIRVIKSYPKGGRYVIAANHISYLDTLVIFPAIPAYFRPLGKIEIAHIPIVGFIYRQVTIMVDRSSAQSRALSMRLLWRVLRKEASIVIFPEGTFNETDAPLKSFYDGAFRLAISTQTPVLPMILPDTVHRWHYSAWWKIWPGRNRIIFLDPVQVTGLTINDLPMLRQKVYELMEAALLQYR